MPLVSVVIPTHNRPEMLREALESVKAQTFTDYEIIIVSNGETCENFTESRVLAAAYGCHYIILAEGNVSAARNEGVRVSRGEWIAFLDDDDIWLPNKLEYQLAAAKRTNADMIVANHLDQFSDGAKKYHTWEYPEGWPALKAICYGKWTALPSAVLITKSSFRSIGGFDPHQKCGAEDSDLWRRVLWRHKIHIMNEFLFNYRLGHPRLSINRNVAHRYDFRHCIKMYFDTPNDLRWSLPPVTLCVRQLALRILMPYWLRQPRKTWLKLRGKDGSRSVST